MYSLPCPKFFAFVYRLPAYEGALHARIEQEKKQDDNAKGVPVNSDTTYREVPADAKSIATSDLGEFIELAEG